jgi:hypothetical protein
MKQKLHCSLAIATASLIPLLGCSEGPIKTVPVYGTITFVGREPPQATDIIFRPVKVEGVSRPTFVNRQPDGSYRAKAFANSKGLVPGTYQISLTMHDVKPGSNPNVDANWKTWDYDAGKIEVPADSGGIEHNIEVPKKG